jgi:uncharacterized cupredoxin-like copper-binding protein
MALVALALASLGLYACGGGSHATESRARVVRVTERDFRISAPKRLPAGDFVLSVANRGPDNHELIVAREGASHLAFRKDGLTLDEDAAEHSIVGALEPGAPGARRRLKVTLKPGHYVFFCNMFGHYLGGMDHDFEVR